MFAELNRYTKESLTAKLKNITDVAETASETGQGAASAESRIRRSTEAGDKARVAFLKTLFVGRNVFSLFPSENTVYVDTQEQATEVINALQGIGYKNIHTYVPKVCDGNGGSKNDPENNLAVQFSAKEEMIIGDCAKGMIKLFAHLVDEYKDLVVHTYCYIGDYQLTFRDKDAAYALVDTVNKYLGEVAQLAKEHGKKGFPTHDCYVEKKSLDLFVANIKLKHA